MKFLLKKMTIDTKKQQNHRRCHLYEILSTSLIFSTSKATNAFLSNKKTAKLKFLKRF